ncbi:MAG TPA: FAD-dependent oxidoreductase [Pseudomonadales bacterium]
MKIAIIGSGISGLTAAYYLHGQHQVTLYEKNSRIGGHTATVDVTLNGRDYAIDTGFIVYNERTYANFIRLLDELGVATRPTRMGFSVSSRINGLEYSGAGLDAMFAQRRNLLNPSHWRMLRDILRFNREAPQHLAAGIVDENVTLGDYLSRYRYSSAFRDHYLVPMGAAIWSAGTDVMMEFPMRFFIRFFDNHGLLQVRNRPQWYVIDGGSRSYIAPLTRGFRQHIVLNSRITAVNRHDSGVRLHHANGTVEEYDEVVFACHSDEALALLADASDAERSVLSAMPYQNNDVVLHTDESLLPALKKTWSSWNYQLNSYRQNMVTLTYNMNILQGIQAPVTFCVTLNDSRSIDPGKVLARFNYAHPVFSRESLAAQQRWGEINGVRHSWFCGAYWRNGFHEDGVVSALQVVNGLKARCGQPGVLVLSNHD